MKKLRQWISRLSVKKKLIFYGYLIITPVLVLICLFLTVNNYNRVITKQLANDLAGVNTLADSIHVLQTDVKDFSTYLCINDEVHKLLTTDDPEEKNKDAKLWLKEASMQIVQDMIALKGHIKTIAVYPENGIRPYLRGMDGSAYVSDIDEIRKTEIYQETLESENGMVWKSVPKGSGELYQTNRTDKIVLCREIFDLTQKKNLGFIIIGVSQERFQEPCLSIVKDPGECVLIFDKNGGELSCVGTLDEEVDAYVKSEEFLSQTYRTRQDHITFKNFDMVCSQADKNAAIVCKVVPRYGMRMQFRDIAYMPVMLLLGMLAGLLPLLVIISNIVTKPLKQVSSAIVEFSKGDFEQKVEVITDDEIGEVAKCFNNMVDDIRRLIEENYVITLKEKESELAALQAQINPHFLYNTLDSLYWQAVDVGNEEIGESILALSQLFRLLLGQGKKVVTVAHEAELVSRYLQIQKMRFSKRLNYEVQMEEDILDARIPKLILQPFVENAIVHGFENVTVPCSLTVTGKREGEYIRFEIRDTGIGMSRQQIDQIWEEEPAQYAKNRIGRFAIRNIKERLELKYHEDFSLDILSSVGKGTTVILKIPFKEEA